MTKQKTLRSNIARSTPSSVTIKGYDLCSDLLGVASLGDMAYLGMMDRLPDARESIMVNAMMVALVEHGITPSAIATRMTYAGAPEAMQAAIGAGLSGLGSNYVGSMENAARLLQEHLNRETNPQATAERIVSACRSDNRQVPGIGHSLHKPVDPRAVRLIEIARDQGFVGRYVETMEEVAHHAGRVLGKSLPMNATGAIAAIASEMGVPWKLVRGLGVAARAVGLLAHIKEEIENPIALTIKKRVQTEAEGGEFE
ncbi:citryl-CoA lyase [Pelagibacterium sp.]|uniref:citryl-CoA lyase n=1 Tax=Pelagibacterium sp. TaxID=1967288 RepID=UPI003A938391